MDVVSEARDSPFLHWQRRKNEDLGFRRTIHRMLVHQSHKETKKGKEKAVTSKTRHDEQCTVRKREREIEKPRERQEVCVRE